MWELKGLSNLKYHSLQCSKCRAGRSPMISTASWITLSSSGTKPVLVIPARLLRDLIWLFRLVDPKRLAITVPLPSRASGSSIVLKFSGLFISSRRLSSSLWILYIQLIKQNVSKFNSKKVVFTYRKMTTAGAVNAPPSKKNAPGKVSMVAL